MDHLKHRFAGSRVDILSNGDTVIHREYDMVSKFPPIKNEQQTMRDESSRPIQCNHCAATFTNVRNFRRHVTKEHKELTVPNNEPHSSRIILPTGQLQIHSKTEGNVRLDRIPLEEGWMAIPAQIAQFSEAGFSIENIAFAGEFCYLLGIKLSAREQSGAGDDDDAGVEV